MRGCLFVAGGRWAAGVCWCGCWPRCAVLASLCLLLSRVGSAACFWVVVAGLLLLLFLLLGWRVPCGRGLGLAVGAVARQVRVLPPCRCSVLVPLWWLVGPCAPLFALVSLCAHAAPPVFFCFCKIYPHTRYLNNEHQV